MNPNSDQKWQIFIGNVSAQTSDEKLRQVFSSVGHVVNVRVMSDRGDPKKGYAFVEYDNPDTALTAIQNLANIDVDGRRLRVGFSNNSGLEAIAKQRGLTVTPSGGVTGKSLESVLGQFSIHEMYDMIAHLKEVAETKPDDLRLLLISHPQIAEAIVHMQVKIGMIRPLIRPGQDQPQQPQLPPMMLQPPTHLGFPPPQPPGPPPYYQPSQPPPPTQAQQQQQQQQWTGGALPPPQPLGVPPPPPPGAPPQGAQGGGGGGGGGLNLAGLGFDPSSALGGLGALMAGGNPAASQQLVKQILELTPEQLAAVEPGRRQMLMDLKQALLAGTGGGGGMPR